MKNILILFAAVLLLAALFTWLRFRDDDKIPLAPSSVDLAEGGSQPSRDLGFDAKYAAETDQGKTQAQNEDVAGADGAAGKEVRGTVLTIKSSEDGWPVVGIDVYAYSPSSIPVRAENMLRSSYDLIREHADHYRSNEKGEVRIRSLGIVTQILALDHRYEGTTNISGTPDEFVFLVEPYLRVPVRVVDSSGSPCFDFPVTTRLSFSQRGRTQTREVWMGLTRAPDGLVQVPIYNLFKASKPERIAVALGGRLADIVEEEIDFDHPLHEPITLVAPDSGSILVKVQAPEGVPLEASTCFAVSIERLTEEGDSGLAPVAMTKKGLTRLPFLGLKASYRVSLVPEVDCAFQSMSQELEGPRVSGEEIEVVFELPQDLTRCILRGRALDETGAVLALEPLQAFSEVRNQEPSVAMNRRVTTDEQGYFTLTIDPEELHDNGEWWLRLEFHADKSLKKRALRNLSGWMAGEHDLGEVILEPDPILASGQVIGLDGKPIPQVLVNFSHKYAHEEESTGLHGAATDEDGRFLWRSQSKATEFLVSARSPGYYSERQSILAGQTDIVIQMQAMSRFCAGLAVEGSDPSRFEGYRYLLIPEGQDSQNRDYPDFGGTIDKELRSGRYDFFVYHQSDLQTAVFSKTGLKLVAGETLDLGEIQLDSPGIKVEIDIVTGKAKPDRRIHGTMRTYAPGSDVPINATQVLVDANPVVLFVEHLPFDVEFELEYCRMVRKRITELKTSIEMTLGLDVSIEVLGLEELPKGIVTTLSLLPHSRREDLPLHDGTEVTIKKPIASFRLPSPGDYDLFISVGGPIKDYAFFKTCINLESPMKLAVLDKNSAQDFQIKLSPSDCKKALAEIEKKR